jgi:hypothetical protein
MIACNGTAFAASWNPSMEGASMFNPLTLVGIHTWFSLVAIAAGIVVLLGLIRGDTRPAGTGVFLATAVLTSVTGFFFPFSEVKPSHIVGGIALLILAVALYGLYGRDLGGRWRAIYVGSAVASLYLLVFVGVAQAFAKIGALQALAPTQSEPPFAIAQGIVLVLFVALGWRAVTRGGGGGGPLAA